MNRHPRAHAAPWRAFLVALILSAALGSAALSQTAAGATASCYFPTISSSGCASHALLSGSSGWSNIRQWNNAKVSNFSSSSFTFQLWRYDPSSSCPNSVCKIGPFTVAAGGTFVSTESQFAHCTVPDTQACKILLNITSSGSRDVSASTLL